MVKTIPDTEQPHGVLCRTVSGEEYVISVSGNERAKKPFTLWKVVKGGYEKIEQAASYDAVTGLVPWKC